MALFGSEPQYNMAGGIVQPKSTGFDYQGLLGNPLLHAGVGLLGSQKGQGAQAALQGLMQGQQVQQSFADRDKKEAEDKRMQELAASLPELFAEGGAAGVAPALLGNPETIALGLKAGGVGAARQPLIQGSPTKLANGNLGYLSAATGEVVDTGTQFYEAPKTFGAGGVQYAFNPITGVPTQLIGADKVAADAAQIEGAKAGATTTAKASAEGVAQAPQAIENADNMIAVLDKAINHPGRKMATGFSSTFNKFQPKGSTVTDFLTVTDQLKGAAFLQAFESLKGGGQITEVEGKKATEAIARLNEAQSEGEYLSALKEFKAIIQRGKERAEGKLGGKKSSGNIPTLNTQAEYDALPSGSTYIDPDDGKQYRKP